MLEDGNMLAADPTYGRTDADADGGREGDNRPPQAVAAAQDES